MAKTMDYIVNKIRDILRKEGITGMDSINHCIAFLVCRMLNEDLCLLLLNIFGICSTFWVLSRMWGPPWGAPLFPWGAPPGVPPWICSIDK